MFGWEQTCSMNQADSLKDAERIKLNCLCKTKVMYSISSKDDTALLELIRRILFPDTAGVTQDHIDSQHRINEMSYLQ